MIRISLIIPTYNLSVSWSFWSKLIDFTVTFVVKRTSDHKTFKMSKDDFKNYIMTLSWSSRVTKNPSCFILASFFQS